MIIRVVLADDHRMIREALRGTLEAEPDIKVVGEAETGAGTLAIIDRDCPDVLVLDINLPDINGIEVARAAIKRHPAIRILALSGNAEKVYVDEMIRAGALGYVVKSAGSDELIAAIRAVASGRNYLSAEAQTALLRHLRVGDGEPPPPSVLSRREVEVLRQLAGGSRSAEIAARLGITEATVEVHRHNIKAKLGLRNIADLTRYAIRNGLTTA